MTTARAGRGEVVREFLDLLEREEAALLTWGVVDGGFSSEDLAERAVEFCSEDSRWGELSSAELVDEMLRRHLIIDLPWGGTRLYRTRMAEAVRLFARLRQMFTLPQWSTGPSLVSDFRFLLQPRVYPRRDISTVTAVKEWQDAGVVSGLRAKAIGALLDRVDVQSLAGFQVRATTQVLSDLDSGWDRGMIVTVGTGSGKTLAFYLPALAQVASLIDRESFWTKAIAIYPRNELLKDQFAETYVEARRLDALLKGEGRRKVLIGAFFGPTPYDASAPALQQAGWSRTGNGYVCPFLRCTRSDCGGDLVWRLSDIAEHRERLGCVRCGAIVEEDEVLLTRRRMQQTPPDVLFGTTEMLNRVMADSFSCHVFGVNARRAPHILLLDEVHTYSGTQGAQVALLLRRWRHAVGRRGVQFTGLSATLRNATDFFSQLTGLRESSVVEIAPLAQELETEGMEYLLALRGDPVSKTSLLSTTIQTAMLLRRVLDPGGEQGAVAGPPSYGMYGRKVFLFTDDLDVTNRLYHDLLDAEGLSTRNIPRPGRAPLAALRARGLADNARRLLAGQSWQLCEEIGHPEGLGIPLTIGRTSSQDVGVDRRGDVIVATASLEVGYNDQQVGAVLQHKAPRDAAQFLQRKGRAGRPRTMRPWTVVVLSDYGRDRLAYQSYESLFAPDLSPRALPVGNRYVLRIQAVFAFMDWLSGQLKNAPRGSVYRDLSGPSSSTTVHQRQEEEAGAIRRVLEGDEQLNDSLSRHLEDALKVSEDEVAALMWDPPRSLMMQVLPTVLRRLEGQWRRIQSAPGEVGQDYLAPHHPLPDFVPASLFADLNLPEVLVVSPERLGAQSTREDSLPIEQALRTLVPGKVTRRFAVREADVSHWIAIAAIDPTATRQTVAVEQYFAEYEDVGPIQVIDDGQVRAFRCVRPWTIQPAIMPPQVLPTSNALLKWQSQVIRGPQGQPLEVPRDSLWAAHVRDISFFGHVNREHVEVRRFSLGARATVRRRGRNMPEVCADVAFVSAESQTPVAVGFKAYVDGVRFQVQLPTQGLVGTAGALSRKARGFRTAYFRHLVLTDPLLEARANSFQLDWLQQVYLSALTAWSIKERVSLAEAGQALGRNVYPAAEKVLRVIFETLEVDEGDGGGDEDDDDKGGPQVGTPAGSGHRRLRDEVLALFARDEVARRLRELAAALWSEPTAEWEAWARERFRATLGAAFLEASRQLYPEASADDLVLDTDSGASPTGQASAPSDVGEIWLTETTLGGGGVLEEVARRYSEDPRRFFRIVESVLGPSDYEVLDAELTRTLRLIRDTPQVADAVAGVRRSGRHAELVSAVTRLERLLWSRGVLVNKTVMNAVHTRILRPGSNPQTDHLLLDLVQQWNECERELGIEVDARVFAYLASESTALSEALSHLDAAITDDRTFRFHAIYGLLWLRGNVIRSLHLASYNPYVTTPPLDRELVLDWIVRPLAPIPVLEPGWRDRVVDQLRAEGTAAIAARIEDVHALKAAVIALAVDPIEVDFLHLYPQVEGIRRSEDLVVVTLNLVEVVQ